jgi:Cu+-exporting ATPase
MLTTVAQIDPVCGMTVDSDHAAGSFDRSFLDDPTLEVRAEELRANGQTIVFVVIDGKPAGLIGVADPIKETTPNAVKQLHDEGIRLVMLTGDSRTTAQAVARKLGIDEVVAEVLPDQKVEAVKKLQNAGWIVAMAGDGINDAPALAQAHVGIAMGTGVDVAMSFSSVSVIANALRLRNHR